ncbi:type III polyketide synthase [Algoriphagus mannitolivorans]|uniref:type III polyketide synthase n=1 Tax=Algoriphagus mannitolivorans TaxID=226504 RepID=UPI00047A5586|nr:type III polyketide synthase [Algoriphagus mannitolivorans]
MEGNQTIYPSIVSIGTANPGKGVLQTDIAEFMKMAHQLSEEDSRKLGIFYRMSGIQTRYSVISDFENKTPEEFSFFPKSKNLEPFPGTKIRMENFGQHAPILATEAAQNCLSKSGTSPKDISHLILVSCTGMMAPGVEMRLIENLGLNSSVERYCLHFMGCYAAFSGIKLAEKILKADSNAQVLLVTVELCTLHFQKEYTEDNVLANSLFGDGAAAALLQNSSTGLGVKDHFSQVIWEGEQDMAWGIGDFGFEMKLSKYIPALLDQGIKGLMEYFEQKFEISKISNFAIHPGGKQILQKVQEALGVSPEVNRHSVEVLRNFGNMSSATILFVLEKFLDDTGTDGEILSLGFGPGLTLETVLFEKS